MLCYQQTNHTNSLLGQLGKFEYRLDVRLECMKGLFGHFVRYDNGIIIMWESEWYYNYVRKCPYF